jgi:hypothetical protein
MNVTSIFSKITKPVDKVDLRVIHVLIGCKTHLDTKPGPKSIHEFPRLARLLLSDPTSIFDNTMNSYAHYKRDLTIHQILYLIDPLYENTDPVFTRDGIKELSNNGSNTITTRDCTIISTIEAVVCPINTSSKEMTAFVEVLKSYPDTLINIQDTTGSSMCSGIFQSDHQIHILNSDCFLDTSAKIACPAISFLRWVNIKQDILKILSDPYTGDEYAADYLKLVTEHVFFKKELVALSSIWSLIECNEEANHIITGKIKLSDITVKTYSANYRLFIRPYFEYRRQGNIVFDQIIKFLDSWNETLYYSPDSDTRTFLDVVKQECGARLEVLGMEPCGIHRDLVSIIEKNANKVQ